MSGYAQFSKPPLLDASMGTMIKMCHKKGH
jgi:hypothetical protein